MFAQCKSVSHLQFIVWITLAMASARCALAAQSSASAVQRPRFGHGTLIQIAAPANPLRVAEKAQISLILHDKALTSVVATQGRYLDAEHKVRDAYGIDGGEQTVPVLYRSDGSAYIEFTPLRLGEIELAVFGTFPDRATDRSSIFLTIVPTERKPAALFVAQRGMPGTDADVLRLNLDDSEGLAQHPERKEFLFPEAYYYDLPYPVDIDKPFTRFAVKQNENNPVLEFDPATSGMRPIRRGTALVVTSYGGLVKTTCILVRVERDINDSSDCERLLLAASPRVSDSLETTWLQNPYGMSNPFLGADFKFLTKRLRVTAPDHPVEFGQPIDIPVETSSGKVLYYTVAQMRPGPTNPSGLHVSPTTADGSLKYIPLIPLQFDDDLVLIAAHFADGGVSQRFFRLHVTESCKGFKSLDLHSYPRSDGHVSVTATLHYEQLKNPVQLPDLKRLTWRIDQGSPPDALSIETDGQIRSEHTGDAAIIATYCGVTTGLEVRVHKSAP